MAYDEELAERVRELLAGETTSEKRMFGGLAFLIDGKMAIAVSHAGGILVRVDPVASERLLRGAGVEPAVMSGRQLRGWLRVDPERLRTKRQLEPWVRRGLEHVHAPSA